MISWIGRKRRLANAFRFILIWESGGQGISMGCDYCELNALHLMILLL